ncbi:hypothetical protein [Maribacter sp. 2307ULW6-5]|uniref:hypothetical protein n=1 Tax=Maribacter sp. 2307ULW6-5 TaxID=3386275 RepID=UPI0039BD05B6
MKQKGRFLGAGMALLLCGFPMAQQAAATPEMNNSLGVPYGHNKRAADSLEGAWAYEAEGVDYPYRKGTLLIGRKNEAYTVQVNLPQGSMDGYQVTVKDGTIRFFLNVDGVERVAVSLEQKGDTLQGKAVTSQGTFSVTAQRKLPGKE